MCPCCRRVTTNETDQAFIRFHEEEDNLLNVAAEKVLELINKPRMATATGGMSGEKAYTVRESELASIREIFLRFKALDDAKIEHQHAIERLLAMSLEMGQSD